ncbi:MAG: hypothetical protein RML46_11385 [Anaerolineae bacterium]|nr:hypothetical protein [Anaerolineae bacterium]
MRRWIPWVLLIGALLGLMGAVISWIPHRAAALRLNPLDLFVIVRLLPPVRDGVVRVAREVFLLPLLTPALVLALVPTFCAQPRGLLRYGSALFGAALSLTMLPPYPSVFTAWQDPQYRWQFFLTVGFGGLALLSLGSGRLPARVRGGLIAVLALVGWALPFLSFLRVRPLFSALYGAPVGMGPGIFLSLLGTVLTVATGSFLTLSGYRNIR